MIHFAAVFIGGGLGSLSRFAISRMLSEYNTLFPWSTFISNVTSCIIMALFLVKFQQKINNELARSFIMIGFCGGFSTFSTFSLETLQLIKLNYWPIAALNIAANISFCIFILYLFATKSTTL